MFLVKKNLEFMGEIDYYKHETLESATTMLEAIKDYILGEEYEDLKEREPGLKYEVEDYCFSVKAGELESLRRVFIMDYNRGRIDYEIEILKLK